MRRLWRLALVLSCGAGSLSAQETLVREREARLGDREPTGYLGITFTAPLQRIVDRNGVGVVHYGYPAVESVEPGSPASAAGISAGDTILAYDSIDVVNHQISLTHLLRPGRRVLVRVRRNGLIKDVPVTVAPRPASFVESMAYPPSTMTIRIPPFPSSGAMTAAGAALVSTNEDLRVALGVPRNSIGVLVVDVGEGTPAEESGLRAGDVVVRAGDDSIVSPQAFERAVARAGGRAVTLHVVRAHRLRTVVLQWR